MSSARQIFPCDLTTINESLIDGKLLPMPYSWWDQFPRNTLEYFMYVNGFYILPSVELIEWLKSNIIGMTIEICAGNGSLGRALNIPRTDSYLQSKTDIKNIYQLAKQPPIVYPHDVEMLSAHQAVKKYNPRTVIGSFVTHKWKEGMNEGNMFGVEEEKLVVNVKRYIMIGNANTHASKPLLKYPHDTIILPQLITRGQDQSMNRIWVWTQA